MRIIFHGPRIRALEAFDVACAEERADGGEGGAGYGEAGLDDGPDEGIGATNWWGVSL